MFAPPTDLPCCSPRRSCCPPLAAAQSNVYRWVDKDGKVHYSDTPPGAREEPSPRSACGGGWRNRPQLPYATQVAMKKSPVTLYSGADCGEPCKQGARACSPSAASPSASATRRATPTDAEALKKLIGGLEVPVLTVGANKVKGLRGGRVAFGPRRRRLSRAPRLPGRLPPRPAAAPKKAERRPRPRRQPAHGRALARRKGRATREARTAGPIPGAGDRPRHEARHLERELAQGAPAAPARAPRAPFARRGLPAGNQVRGRGLSRRASWRLPATAGFTTGRRPTTAWRSSRARSPRDVVARHSGIRGPAEARDRGRHRRRARRERRTAPTGRASARTSTSTSCAGSRRWRLARGRTRRAAGAGRRARRLQHRPRGPRRARSGRVARPGAGAATPSARRCAPSWRSGFSDAFRLFEQPEKSYSWWDYRMAAFRRNMGLRIDHILLSPGLAPRCRVVHDRRRAAQARASVGPRAGDLRRRGLRARLGDGVPRPGGRAPGAARGLPHPRNAPRAGLRRPRAPRPGGRARADRLARVRRRRARVDQGRRGHRLHGACRCAPARLPRRAARRRRRDRGRDGDGAARASARRGRTPPALPVRGAARDLRRARRGGPRGRRSRASPPRSRGAHRAGEPRDPRARAAGGAAVARPRTSIRERPGNGPRMPRTSSPASGNSPRPCSRACRARSSCCPGRGGSCAGTRGCRRRSATRAWNSRPCAPSTSSCRRTARWPRRRFAKSSVPAGKAPSRSAQGQDRRMPAVRLRREAPPGGR